MAEQTASTATPKRRRWVRPALLTLLVPLAILVALVLAIAACNLVDEDLNPATQALMVQPPMGKADDSNGYVAFLGMSGPAGQDPAEWGRKAAQAYAAQGTPGFAKTPEWDNATRTHLMATKEAAWCIPEKQDCVALAREKRDSLQAVLAQAPHPELLARYRVVREKPVFADVSIGTDPLAMLPAFPRLVEASALTRLDIALKAAAGDVDAAVAELEREIAFHRRMLAEGRTLITVMVGNTLLVRDLLVASELLRAGGTAVAPFRARLQTAAGIPVDMKSMEVAMQNEASMGLSFTKGLRAKMRDERAKEMYGALGINPLSSSSWWFSWLVRENETVNLLAALYASEMASLKVPAASFNEARKAAVDRKNALVEHSWYGAFFNPVGKGIATAMLPSFQSYVARMHDLEALRRMVHLQATMAERGIAEPAAMAAFVAGEGAKEDANPLTGKPFDFDPGKRRLSFDPVGTGSFMAELKQRFDGRAAIQL
jgi:hypothetical protein